MIILGIETSFDETAVAIVEDGKKVLAEVTATSADMHIKTGGVIPEKAAREQVNSIIPVINECLKIASITRNDIDNIAVTYGPGLIGSLLVGVETAKTLSMVWDKPLIPVNHLQAHLYACFLDNSPEFPLVGLVVSGGHTDFVYMESPGKIKHIGGTRDDAAGEAFDKTARLLGLPYPGGPAISAAAESFLRKQESTVEQQALLTQTDPGSRSGMTLFPRPMIHSKNLDMSFSGLKTSVLNYVKSHPELVSGSRSRIGEQRPSSACRDDMGRIAAEIQEAIVDTIVAKVAFAMEKYKPKSFLLAGGVSANTRLRNKLQVLYSNYEKGEFYVPQVQYTTDNAVMIAAAAFYNPKIVSWKNVNANPNLGIEE